jgi:hypothetical protein
LVNKAPVDFRAWVLQERLLAPRVLHFCKGSIAWECGGFTRAEGHPTGLPRFQLQHDKILPEVSLKGLHPSKHGKGLKTIRLGDHKEPDPHIPERDLYGFELWARAVEMYSRMNLKLASSSLYPGLRNSCQPAYLALKMTRPSMWPVCGANILKASFYGGLSPFSYDMIEVSNSQAHDQSISEHRHFPRLCRCTKKPQRPTRQQHLIRRGDRPRLTYQGQKE